MTTTSGRKTIRIDAESELAALLAEAANADALVESDGALYFVIRVQEQGAGQVGGYDPERVRRALARYGGSWSDVDAEALKAYIYRGREDGTRPLDER